MKKYIDMMIVFVIAVVCLLFAQVDCRIRPVLSEHELQQLNKKAPVLVALFYKNDKKDKTVLSNYKKVSDKQKYDEAGVVFVTIDVDQKGSAQLMTRYAVEGTPAVILFDSSVMAPYGKVGQLVGFKTSQQLYNFIEDRCGARIDNLIAEKQKKDIKKEKQDVLDKDPYFDTGAQVFPDFPQPYSRGPYNPR